MEKITTTVYLEVPVSERLPEEYGWYSTLYLANLQDFFWFENGKFYNPEDRETPIDVTHWIEKKEEMVCMSKEEAIKWAGEIWEAAFKKSGENMIDHIIEIPNPAPDKDTYINNLFK